MKIEKLSMVLLAGSLCALAQGPGPGPGRGRMGFGAPPDGGLRILGAEAGMPRSVVKNAPYSTDVVTENVQTLSDGNHVRQSATVKVYRDSEGRTRREQSVNLNGLAGNTSMPQVVFINDPVAGMNYALNPKERNGTRTTWTPGAGRMGQGRGPGGPPRGGPHAVDGQRVGPAQNIKTEELGRQTMEGLQVEGRRVTMTIPAGSMGNEQPIQIVTESWYSPDLQVTVLSKRSDPRFGESVTRMTNVSRAEPPHALFEAPADYKVTESEGRMPRPRSTQNPQQK